MRISAKRFEVNYLSLPDRLLLTVRMSATEQFGMQLTRRLTRNFLTALVQAIKKQPQVAAMPNSVAKDAVMNFQHSHSVSEARSNGTLLKKQPDDHRLVEGGEIREIKISRKSETEVSIISSNETHVLVLNIPPAHLHLVLEIFLQISKDAEWDFPPIANWLEATESQLQSDLPRMMN